MNWEAFARQLAQEYYGKNYKPQTTPLKRRRRNDNLTKLPKPKKKREAPLLDTNLITFSFLEICDIYKSVVRVCKEWREQVLQYSEFLLKDHKSLRLRNRKQKLSPKSYEEMKRVFRMLKNLKEIDFSENHQITTDALLILIENSKNTLQKLNLQNCTNLKNKLYSQYIFSELTSIYELNLSRQSSLVQILSFFPNVTRQLRVLNISKCWELTNDDLINLFEACPALEDLNVSECKTLSGTTLRVVAGENLKRLNIAGCFRVSDNALEILGKRCSKLNYLNIGLRPKSGNIFVKNCFRSFDSLEELDMEDNFSFNSEREFLQNISHLKNLKKLNMSGEHIGFKITKFTIPTLKRRLKKLEFIRIGHEIWRKENGHWDYEKIVQNPRKRILLKYD